MCQPMNTLTFSFSKENYIIIKIEENVFPSFNKSNL